MMMSLFTSVQCHGFSALCQTFITHSVGIIEGRDGRLAQGTLWLVVQAPVNAGSAIRVAAGGRDGLPE